MWEIKLITKFRLSCSTHLLSHISWLPHLFEVLWTKQFSWISEPCGSSESMHCCAGCSEQQTHYREFNEGLLHYLIISLDCISSSLSISRSSIWCYCFLQTCSVHLSHFHVLNFLMQYGLLIRAGFWFSARSLRDWPLLMCW
jgi:hypothetical protein